MSKRVIHSTLGIYRFSNNTKGEVGMLIEKNGVKLGVLPLFEYDENLDGDYLIELAFDFERKISN